MSLTGEITVVMKKSEINRIKRLLPDNRFEFIMASSEYVIRTPQQDVV